MAAYARRLLALSLLACLCACSKPEATPDVSNEPPHDETAPPTTAAVPTGEPTAKLRIAVVPKAVTHEFWNTVKAGAESAAGELNAEVLWKGPDAETDVSAQKGIIEDFTTQKVDAIVMAACDADALVSTIQAAEQAGIPVITIDSGVNWEDVRCLVATDNVAGAKAAGEELLRRINGKGKVGLIPFIKGAASSEDREKGFKQALEANTAVQLVATLYSDSDVGKGKEKAADMLTQYPDLAGIFAANEPGAVGAASAISEAGKKGKVILIGFDGSPDEQRLLREGVIQALVVQNPFRMGYEGLAQAVKAAHKETVEKRVDTGVTIVSEDNIDSPDVQKLLNPTGATAG